MISLFSSFQSVSCMCFVNLYTHQDSNEEDLEIAKLLIDAGYQLNDVPHRSSWYKFGGTAIKMAAEYGATDIVQMMLERGADPDIPGR
jgi:ankyrin repeat protein